MNRHLRILSIAFWVFICLPSYAGEAIPHSPSFLSTVDAPHEARVIDSEIVALENILRMIHRAEESIEAEYFIFNPDHAGKLVLQALVEKARKANAPRAGRTGGAILSRCMPCASSSLSD